MKVTYCPLCHEPLEVREVSPCMDCGSRLELGPERVGMYTYAEYRVFGELSLVLCNFCRWDFGSYDPAFFGLPRGTRMWAIDFGFLREVPPVITKDKCCVHCGYRLPFLEFVARVRELYDEEDPA